MKIVKRTIIDQDLDRLWQIMATDYTRVGEWTTTVTASRDNDSVGDRIDGAPAGGRVCTTPGFGDVKETITHFDEEAKSFRYEADASAMPPFVKGVANRWSFRSLGPRRTEVTMAMELDLNAFPGALMAPLMRRQMGRVADTVIEELKHYAETGRVHPSKATALRKAGRPVAPTSAATGS